MAGAHWMSDIMVGGISTALTALAFGLYTPLLNTPQKILNKITELRTILQRESPNS
jgi:membrane-associated phospholipid phosphatase